MTNYVRSELYRIFRSRQIYIWTMVFAVLSSAINVIDCIVYRTTPNFPYGTVRFAMSIFISYIPIFLYAACVVVIVLFNGEWRNGTIKNAIVFGLSREQLLIGKCISYIVSAVFSMFVIIGTYIGTAILLLEGPKTEYVLHLLVGVVAVFLNAVASVILTLVLFFIMKNAITVFLNWYAIIIAIPGIINVLGYKFPVLAKIAAWMPGVFLKQQVTMNMNTYQALWDTPEGMFKCIFTGCIGILVFSVFGIFALRKMEV